MKKLSYFLPLLFLLMFAGNTSKTFAQSEPVLYFCEKYDDDDGEVGISDRFRTGYLTVVVKCSNPLGVKDVHVQFDKYNASTGKFKFYKKFSYVIDKKSKYVYFSKNDESDMSFDDAGFYRVFLLDDDDKTVASALIEIID